MATMKLKTLIAIWALLAIAMTFPICANANIAVGAHTSNRFSGGAGPFGPTTAINVAAGSGVYVTVETGAGSAPTITLADSSSNNWSAAGAAISQVFNSNSGAYINRWYLPPANVTGGSSYTVTITSSVTLFPSYVTVEEVVGASTTAFITQSNFTNAGFNSGPISSNTLVISSPPSNGVLLLSGMATDLGSTATFTESNGFTIVESNTNGAVPPAGVVGSLTVTSGGTYNASWNDGGGADRSAWVDAIPGSAGAGRKPTTLLLGVGASLRSPHHLYHDIDPIDRRRAANESIFKAAA